MFIKMAKARPPGTPLTWGEAFVAALFVFFLLLMMYGVVPDRWLRWSDNELKWRADKLGIPLGPFGHYLYNWFGIGTKQNVLWPKGISFGGRGKIIISAHIIEDIVATLIYGVGLVGQVVMWLWWQGRGKRTEKPALEQRSAYG